MEVKITRWTDIPGGTHDGRCWKCGTSCFRFYYHVGVCLCHKHAKQWATKLKFKKKPHLTE